MNETSTVENPPVSFSNEFKSADLKKKESKKKVVPVCPIDPAELSQCDSCQ